MYRLKGRRNSPHYLILISLSFCLGWVGIPLCWDLRKVNNYQLSLTSFHYFSLIKPVILGGTLKQITKVWELGFGVNFSFSLYFSEMESKAGESYQKHDL